MKKLSKPSKVASILDWKKTFHHTILAVNFHKNRVGIAIASHPSLGIPCMELEPLRFEDHRGNGKGIVGAIDRKCLERFSEIIEEHKVCGVVVNWPIQHETGRMGAACGRVLFALEQLWERSNETIPDDESSDASTLELQRGGLLSRPFCLWDAGHINLSDPAHRVDNFGRCSSYGKENEKAELKEKNYFASKEQYYEDELTVVLGVWDDFCREHWPELYTQTEQGTDEDNSGSDLQSLYKKLDPPATEMSSKLQEMTKNKRSLITMR